MTLTPTQTHTLAFIRSYLTEHGITPTYREIAEAAGVSKVSVHEQVKRLIERGSLRRVPYMARGLELVDRESVRRLDLMIDSTPASQPTMRGVLQEIRDLVVAGN